ncbi:DUF1648 domain-containing protein [Clostridium rectalis]|uniref:DUF1648 domain-containing protein n=1 Tax=Clostridium rectalis TaxID=2040295 RepID=UPI000F641D56|nr:DUF1648 domain-containing protein [Clostridium rectalis]
MNTTQKYILILIVPIAIMIFLTPFLPDKVPIHFTSSGIADGFIHKKYAFALGILPFLIYKIVKIKNNN